MKSIKKQLLITILSVVFGFGMLVCFMTLSELMRQKNTIRERGEKGAETMAEGTGRTLEALNEQIATDFASACSKYFNARFIAMREHVESIKKNLDKLYKTEGNGGGLDEEVGLVKGVRPEEVQEEFGKISPIRDFIKCLPEYDSTKRERLDLYVMTESGMCLDGAGEKMGREYLDLRKEDWYVQTKKMAKGDVYWSGLFTGKLSKKEKVICTMPVRDEQKNYLGCVAGDIEVDAFKELLEEFKEEQILSVVFFDRQGELMHATKGYRNSGQIRKYLGKENVVSMGTEMYAFTELPETGWSICLVLNQEAVRKTEEVLQSDVEKNARGIAEIVQQSIQKIVGMFVVSMAIGVLLTIVVTNFVAGGFVRPIRQLMSQVREVGSGNLHQVVAVQSKNEIGQLADAFRKMTEELKIYMENLQDMTASRERMTAELHIARRIQMNMLPGTFPAFPDRHDFDIYAAVKPVDAGGGNFYDFFLVDKTHLCVVIGDVSGSGISTTLLAVIAKTNIKNYSQMGYETDRILAETNNQLSYRNDAGLTVSVFVGIMDLQTGVFSYSNAGKLMQLWKHSGKDFSFLPAKSGFALANMENVPYRKQYARFAQGDMLVLYTQGVPETVDAKENEYTQEYLTEYLNLAVKRQYVMREIADSVFGDLQHFSGGAQQRTDSTLLLFRYYGE